MTAAPLSARLRPDVECAPWVIDAVRKLESDLAFQRGVTDSCRTQNAELLQRAERAEAEAAPMRGVLAEMRECFEAAPMLPFSASQVRDWMTRLTSTLVPAAPAGLPTGDARVAWGAVANAGRDSSRRLPRWSHVMGATGLGSSSAAALCIRFKFDPEELVGGAQGSQE